MKTLAAVLLGLRALAITALVGCSPVDHAQQSPSADDAAWAAASEAGTAEACQGYLEAFPTGQHTEEAFRCAIAGSLEIAPYAGMAPEERKPSASSQQDRDFGGGASSGSGSQGGDQGGGDQGGGLGLVVHRPVAQMLGARPERLLQEIAAGPAQAGPEIDTRALGRH
jgi:hypothetical protein